MKGIYGLCPCCHACGPPTDLSDPRKLTRFCDLCENEVTDKVIYPLCGYSLVTWCIFKFENVTAESSCKDSNFHYDEF